MLSLSHHPQPALLNDLCDGAQPCERGRRKEERGERREEGKREAEEEERGGRGGKGRGKGRRRKRREEGKREVKKEEERVFIHQPASHTPVYRNLTVIKHSCMTIHTTCRSPSL